MTEILRSYRLLELRLWDTRWRLAGDESPEEDAILDQMDLVWWKLSDDERDVLRSEGPRCWPMDPSCWPPALLASGIATPAPWAYEDFRSPQDAILDADVA